MTPAQRKRKQRWRWKQRGLCLSCGAVRRPGLTTCGPCATRASAYQRSRRAERKASGVCVRCAVPLDTDGQYLNCEWCREKHQDYRYDLRRRRREALLCITCGQPLDDLARMTCSSCLAKQRAARTAG